MISEGTIKRLKVFALPDGRLLPNYRQGARQPVDDDWWHDVLHDPRAHLPVTETSFNHDSRYAHYRLDRQRGETVAFTCRCGRDRVLSKAVLIKAEGAERQRVMDCSPRHCRL